MIGAMTLIERFMALGTVDGRRLGLERKLVQAPQAAHAADAKAKQARDAIVRFKEDAKKASLETKRLEAEAKAKQAELEKTQINQNQSKANDEFKLLGKKIEGLKAEIGELESKLLEEYERNDSRGSDLAALEGKAKEAETEAARLRKDADAAIAVLKADLAKVEAERVAISSGIEKKALDMYRSALEQHHDTAIAQVVGGFCQGCSMTVRPNQLSILKGRDQIVTCTQCERILYLEASS